MPEILTAYTWPDPSELTNPELVVNLPDGRTIFSTEFFDRMLTGWDGSDAYTELSHLEDGRSGHGYGPAKKKPAVYTPGRERELYMHRPVAAADELVDLLDAVRPFNNYAKGTRAHVLGSDGNSGLHATLLSTRGLENIELPDEDTFAPKIKVPSILKPLVELSLEGVALFEGNVKHHVVLRFGHKAFAKITREREELERVYFPGLSLVPIVAKRLYDPHVTIVSARDPAIARQAYETVLAMPQKPRMISLSPARFSFDEIR